MNRGEQKQLKSAAQNPPREAGIELSNWNWKVVWQFLKQSFALVLSRSCCLNYLHRLAFPLKRTKKRLLKAKQEERKAFVLQYSQIRKEARERGWTTPRVLINGVQSPRGLLGKTRSKHELAIEAARASC